MSRQEVDHLAHVEAALHVLSHDGALLVAAKKTGIANVMTIGWGTFGWIWGIPVVSVLVRPSRYTWEFLEDNGEFTVNVPGPDLAETAAYCGAISGRDRDKFAERGLTRRPARDVNVPYIEECPLHYECSVVHSYDLDPVALEADIVQSAYSSGDFHRVYVGRILCAFAEPDVAERLAVTDA